MTDFNDTAAAIQVCQCMLFVFFGRDDMLLLTARSELGVENDMLKIIKKECSTRFARVD